MRKNKYEVLDQILVEKIASGMCHFKQLVNTTEIKVEAFKSVRNPDDVLNGRLQALRKADKIQCLPGLGWFVTALLRAAKPGEKLHDTLLEGIEAQAQVTCRAIERMEETKRMLPGNKPA
jgi:hypothetical protein